MTDYLSYSLLTLVNRFVFTYKQFLIKYFIFFLKIDTQYLTTVQCNEMNIGSNSVLYIPAAVVTGMTQTVGHT